MSHAESRFTVVSFHAHPDDEALLTAGTLAQAAAAGHRVVLVVATDGEAGLAAGGFLADGLGGIRRRELELSARAIGAARVEFLGYPDSGYCADAAPAGTTFAETEVEEVAERLAGLLREEAADVLTTYDAAGGYGHLDHIQVHRVGRLAGQLASTPVVLEATIDREALLFGACLLRWLARVVPIPALPDLTSAYTDRDSLTHCIDVREFLPEKRAAMRAHVTQASSDGSPRTLAMLLRLPGPLARSALGREWFRETGRTPGEPLLADIFDTLRSSVSVGP